MRTLNLGILAHVDAGKTSLTERLLFDTGAIARLGSVDGGNTQTDSLELERQRGITIAAAVVSFSLGDLTVNLIDTPGHPDFIAEVERVLQMLDAAVVVVSAVEGVQAQTRILVRALKRLGIPFVFFINKIDRLGARYEELLDDIERQLAVAPIAMVDVENLGSRAAMVGARDPASEPFYSGLSDILSRNDEELLEDYATGVSRLPAERLHTALAEQLAKGLVHPAYCGIAMTGLGLAELISAIETLMPSRTPDRSGPLQGMIFKIERGWGGEKIAYANLVSGALGLRDLVRLPAGQARVASLQVFCNGQIQKVERAGAGHIVKIGGLSAAKIGDPIGDLTRAPPPFHFAPPTLETRILPVRPSETTALWISLQQLSEQDPLIDLRIADDAGQIFVSLYGEVQKEVIEATLATEFGLSVTFEESTVICAERVRGVGHGYQEIFRDPNPFFATIGLRVEPRPEGSGSSFALEVDVGQMPAGFYRAVEETVYETLKAGIYGWQVIDCHVAMTAVRHSAPSSTAVDFRNLTPIVLAEALTHAQTVLCEPVDQFRLEGPRGSMPAITAMLARTGAAATDIDMDDETMRLEGRVPTAQVQAIQRQLPGQTGGQGVLEHAFAHYAEIAGKQPIRSRSGADPFNRDIYLKQVR